MPDSVTPREWTIPRIEALRWRVLKRLYEKITPAYRAAIDHVRDLDGAYHQNEGDDRIIKLTPVRPGGTRVAWSVRRVSPRQASADAHALVQLATIPLPTNEELEVGAHYIAMRNWRDTYIARLKYANGRLYVTLCKEFLTREGSVRSAVFRINGRLYPTSRGWLNAHDSAHSWWPRYPDQVGVIDVSD